jgi:L,D-peptidoglycan transpeptidase YkuD (ErfK/YbiS/YcfS/YnhG family)
MFLFKFVTPLLTCLVLVLLPIICATGFNRTENNHNITVTYTGGWSCTLDFMSHRFPCALGKNGVTTNKQEGDGKTPLGTFPLRRAFYRADKYNTSLLTSPSSQTSRNCFGTSSYLNCEATQPTFGWVDDVNDTLYNQFVLLPYSASHEDLYLSTSFVYDLLAVIGYNDDPIIPGLGSAIFFHVASDGYGATAGCVSLALQDLAFVLSKVHPNTHMTIQE